MSTEDPTTTVNQATKATTTSNTTFSKCLDEATGLAGSDTSSTTNSNTALEALEFTVLYNKNKYPFSLAPTTTVSELRLQIEKLTELPAVMQKIMHKGTTFKEPDETLWNVGIRTGSKIMVVGSTFNDILKTAVPRKEITKIYQSTSNSERKQPLCKQAIHKKVLSEFNKPKDIMPAYKPLDGPVFLSSDHPINGLLNRFGTQIRMTFKLETDELWIGSNQATTKIKMTSITDVISEPIDGENDLYYIIGLKMGLETLWVYWVPVQYIGAIKSSIFGK